MPYYQNSIVFVGEMFHPGIVDENQLFGGGLDTGSAVRLADQFAQFHYQGGRYRFTITQNRIDLAADGSQVLPIILRESALTVAMEIDRTQQICRASGVGMNCDATFEPELINHFGSGIDYCSYLIRPQFTKLATGATGTNVLPVGQVIFNDQGVRYQVRVEPDLMRSQGENLRVAVNGHQDITGEESIALKLKHFNNFRKYVSEFHQRVTQFRGGG